MLVIKRDAFAKPHIMETYTSQADDLYQEANEIEYPDYVPPYTSCYESLLEFEEIITRAREMESAARDIRKKFQEIAASGLTIPTSSLLRKAIISVKRGKVMFSMDQLVQVVDVMMENLPYILFRPKSETKEYVVLLFWSTNMDDAACEVQKKMEIIKQEIAVDQFQLRCVVENVPAARRQFLYLLNNYIFLKVQKDDVCHLPPDNHEQLETFVKLLTEPEPKKKRKVDFIASTP